VTRNWADLSGFPTDPTPAELRGNVQALAEAIVGNCRALPLTGSVEALHTIHAANAVLGRLIFERSCLLRAGNGAAKLREWADKREGGTTR